MVVQDKHELTCDIMVLNWESVSDTDSEKTVVPPPGSFTCTLHELMDTHVQDWVWGCVVLQIAHHMLIEHTIVYSISLRFSWFFTWALHILCMLANTLSLFHSVHVRTCIIMLRCNFKPLAQLLAGWVNVYWTGRISSGHIHIYMWYH